MSNAGNLTEGKDGYQYSYDYENRIVEIKDSGNTTVAEFDYDALGRRIRKIDSIVSETTLYYYNNNWQVLSETDASGNTQRWYVYGNYIDEPLVMVDANDDQYYYLQNHIYSVVALVDESGTVVERYEYDAYGDCNVLDADFSDDTDGVSDYDNPYLFTGRRWDLLDSNDLKIQYSRNRYYDYYTGRWLTQDPVGYVDGTNLYEYVNSNPVIVADPNGFSGIPYPYYPSPPAPSPKDKCKYDGFSILQWMAVPANEYATPCEVLRHKNIIDKLWLMGAASDTKTTPISVIYSYSTRNAGWALYKSLGHLHMRFCGYCHLYAYVCHWMCVERKKGIWPYRTTVKVPVLSYCSWEKCYQKKDRIGGTLPNSPSWHEGRSRYRYPISKGAQTKCAQVIARDYLDLGEKLHVFRKGDIDNIKNEMKHNCNVTKLWED